MKTMTEPKRSIPPMLLNVANDIMTLLLLSEIILCISGSTAYYQLPMDDLINTCY